MNRARFLSYCAYGFLLLAATSARAQDPLIVNAKTIRLRFENEHVRVLEAELQPGDKEQMHSHPASVVYVLSGGRLRNHAPDGTTAESALEVGAVLYRQPLTHWAENIGTTTIHVIVVELKQP